LKERRLRRKPKKSEQKQESEYDEDGKKIEMEDEIDYNPEQKVIEETEVEYSDRSGYNVSNVEIVSSGDSDLIAKEMNEDMAVKEKDDDKNKKGGKKKKRKYDPDKHYFPGEVSGEELDEVDEVDQLMD
jgi:hypothetical protein